jgi:hypothetical protein
MGVDEPGDRGLAVWLVLWHTFCFCRHVNGGKARDEKKFRKTIDGLKGRGIY